MKRHFKGRRYLENLNACQQIRHPISSLKNSICWDKISNKHFFFVHYNLRTFMKSKQTMILYILSPSNCRFCWRSLLGRLVPVPERRLTCIVHIHQLYEMFGSPLVLNDWLAELSTFQEVRVSLANWTYLHKYVPTYLTTYYVECRCSYTLQHQIKP